jgi:hypothetical protein
MAGQAGVHAMLRYRGVEVCPVYGFRYVPELKEERRIHRARHRQTLNTCDPKPHPALASHYAQTGAFLAIHGKSPRWLRNRLQNMATLFRRELGFDFRPYDADEPEEGDRHWLIISPDGRSTGGLSARMWGTPPAWWWAWVWVIPSERGGGHAGRCWAMLRARFPAIEPSAPFSPPMAKFFAGRDDVTEHTRQHAGRQLQPTEAD